MDLDTSADSFSGGGLSSVLAPKEKAPNPEDFDSETVEPKLGFCSPPELKLPKTEDFFAAGGSLTVSGFEEPKEKDPAAGGEDALEPKAAKPPVEGVDDSVVDFPKKLKAAVASVLAGLANPPKPAKALLGACSPSSAPTGRRLRAVLITLPARAAWPACRNCPASSGASSAFQFSWFNSPPCLLAIGALKEAVF